MKKIISLAVLLCAFAGSALAAAPENALKALVLGNEKAAMEQSLEAGPLAIVVADKAIEADPAALFGMTPAQVAVIKVPFGPDAGLSVTAKDLTAPVVIVLGTDEESVWAVFANTVKASPDLIHAVMKGQVAAQGAILDAKTGTVKLLGMHPDTSSLVGQYLLGITAEATPAEAAKAEAAPAETAKAEEAPAEGHAAPAEIHSAPAEGHGEAAAGHEAAKAEEGSGGGMSFPMLILFVVALVGVVIALDKVVLKD